MVLKTELLNQYYSGDGTLGSICLRSNSCINMVPKKKLLNQYGFGDGAIISICFQRGILGSRRNSWIHMVQKTEFLYNMVPKMEC
jgi:hypothetical protein